MAEFDLASAERAVNAAMYECGYSQRSTERRPTWRHTSEGGFNRRRYKVVRPRWKDTVAFLRRHHYSGSYGSMKLRYGLVDLWQDELVGVVTIGNPMHRNVLTNPLPDLTPYYESGELNRMVLVDRVESNGESHLAAAALRDARRHGLKAIICFSDPVPRPEIGMPGHVGDVYRAMEAIYADRAASNDQIVVLPDNTVLPDRSQSKVRDGEQGAGGVIARLVALGATPPRPEQTGGQWLRQALKELEVRRFQHPGVHRFIFKLGSERQRAAVRIADGFEQDHYPLHPDPIPTYR